MIKRNVLAGVLAMALGMVGWSFQAPVACAIEGIHYDGSSQLYWALVKDSMETFTRETGIKVTAEDRKTQDAVPSLLSGRCNVGGLARKLKLAEKSQSQDLTETLIARDHIAVFVPAASKVTEITKEKLQKVFSGQITDWKDLGDEPGPIQVVIPQTKTTCNRNFTELIMGDIPFAQSSIITETAGAVLEEAKGKRAISFISYGAVSKRTDFKVLKVEGKNPGEDGYPIAQEMYFATLGNPSGDVKKFIDFFLTGSGREIIVKQGLLPVQ
ncbi:MAG: substrate-binding domain-containing protein [Syntrophobacteraceae bacterium]|nr:substrate-binding domain-containing protein [Syntrophobacteraceae bacterium]